MLPPSLSLSMNALLYFHHLIHELTRKLKFINNVTCNVASSFRPNLNGVRQCVRTSASPGLFFEVGSHQPSPQRDESASSGAMMGVGVRADSPQATRLRRVSPNGSTDFGSL